MTLAPTCFGSHRNHHQGAVQYLAKNYKYGSTELVGMDIVNVTAACEPVCDVYISRCRQVLQTVPVRCVQSLFWDVPLFLWKSGSGCLEGSVCLHLSGNVVQEEWHHYDFRNVEEYSLDDKASRLGRLEASERESCENLAALSSLILILTPMSCLRIYMNYQAQ
jgi:hypothetical protein